MRSQLRRQEYVARGWEKAGSREKGRVRNPREVGRTQTLSRRDGGQGKSGMYRKASVLCAV